MEEQGLNETHFDIMIQHFVASLRDLDNDVEHSTIDTAVEVLWMFRGCFVHKTRRDE